MTKLVIDASVALKWVVQENGSQDAMKLLHSVPLAAPELLIAECANILWKKVQRKELASEEALMAARLLERADIEFCPTRNLLELATRIAIDLEHPAYDCVYLGLAQLNGWNFVTADERLLHKLTQPSAAALGMKAFSIVDAVKHYVKAV